MRKALLTGTFDPPTLGHLDIIHRGSQLCDRLIVGVSTQIDKREKELFSSEERKGLLETIASPFKNVEIHPFEGLAVDFARKHQISHLLRALRSSADFDYEWQMAATNRKLSGMETLFLLADPAVLHISSTLIRELASHQAPLEAFIPKEIEQQVASRLRKIKFF